MRQIIITIIPLNKFIEVCFRSVLKFRVQQQILARFLANSILPHRQSFDQYFFQNVLEENRRNPSSSRQGAWHHLKTRVRTWPTWISGHPIGPSQPSGPPRPVTWLALTHQCTAGFFLLHSILGSRLKRAFVALWL